MFVFQRADFAVGKFSMTYLRETVIDFTEPYFYEGGAMAMRRPAGSSNRVSLRGCP